MVTLCPHGSETATERERPCRLLLASAWLEEAVEVFTHKTTSLLILGLLIALPAACVAWDWWKRTSAEVSLPPEPNGAAE